MSPSSRLSIEGRPFIIQPFQTHSGGKCGYCSSKKSSKPLKDVCLPSEAVVGTDIGADGAHILIGLLVLDMSFDDYERCMNMGYRRSGRYLYKGDMLRGCCRMYTIRTKLSQMNVSKEHRQVVNRFKRAISDEPENPMPSKSFDLSSLIQAEKKSSRFRTVFEPASFSEEKYALYVKYQTTVHKDEPGSVTRKQFDGFLVDNPFYSDLQNGTEEDWALLDSWVDNWSKDSPSKRNTRLGHTHECYYLDNKLIAISVIDFLPNSVSSVYFIWDPDYAHLSLGTLLSLREIQMCHELGIPYYYLGYYIDDCKKMRYKAKFGGELLDVCNNVFVSLKSVDALLQGDQFWTLGDVSYKSIEFNDNKIGDDEKMDNILQSKEPVLDLDHSPTVYAGQVVNKAKEIFGDAETYKNANNALRHLKEKFAMEEADIPNVLPGAIPLSQLWDTFNKSTFNLEVNVFDGDVENDICRNFSELLPFQRTIVLETIRMFGFYMVTKRILFILIE